MSSVRDLEEQLEVTQRQNELLKEKLNIHLARWSFDRILLQEMAKKREEAGEEQLYRLAQVELHHGMQIQENIVLQARLAQVELHHGVQIQENIVLQARLDSALGEVEIAKSQLLELKSALEKEKDKKQVSQEKLKKLKCALQEKFLQAAKKKGQEWKTMFENNHRGYIEAVQKMKEKHRLNVEKLNGRIEHLVSELAGLKTERTRRVAVGKQDVQELDGPNDQVMMEAERWKAEKQEIQVLLEERKNLLEEKERWRAKEQEMQELAVEREKQQKELRQLRIEMEKLQAEKEQWAEREHELQDLRLEQEQEVKQLTVERDQLKRKLHGKESEEFYSSLKDKEQLELVRSQRDSLLKEREELQMVRSQRDSLKHERDFVWNQMKQMEEDYSKKLQKKFKQLAQATEEICQLKRDLQLAQTARNEKLVEMTVLKLEAKRGEEDRKQLNEALAALRQVSNAGKSVQYGTNSNRNGKEENDGHSGSVNKRSPYELTAQIKMLQAELKASLHSGSCLPPKDRPELLSPDDHVTWDTLVSQVEQARRTDAEDGMKTSKELEELRRENENLRVMYGQLEAMYKEIQRPEKVTRSMARKDPTSRNLKTELEAAAALSPVKDGPLLMSDDGQRKVLRNFSTSVASQRRGSGSKSRGSKSNLAQKTSVKEVQEQTGPVVDSIEPDMSESSTKRAMSSRPSTRSLRSSKPPVATLPEQQEDALPKRSTRKSQVDSLDRVQPQDESLPKRSTRKRKADIMDGDEAQRVPLRPVAVNEGNYSSIKKAKQQSSRKTEAGSLDCRSKSSVKENNSTRMSSLFSAAFSIPRLNMQTSSAVKS